MSIRSFDPDSAPQPTVAPGTAREAAGHRRPRHRARPLAAITAAIALAVVGLAPATIAHAVDPVVTFEAGDGSAPTQATAVAGAVAIPAAPTRTGYVFAGWYTRATPDPAVRGRGEGPATSGNNFSGITADTTLYARWIADSAANPNARQITTKDGSKETVLGYSLYSGVDLITRTGQVVDPTAYTASGTNPIFKDLSQNGVLDPYEDWTLTTEARAADLAARLKADPDGVPQMAGLMLYSGHQTSWQSPVPTQAQITFLVNDDLRHVLVAGSAPAGQMDIHADWNNSVQSITEGLGYGIPANNSSDPRHGASASSNVEYYSANAAVSKWPSSLGMAATFDTSLNKQFGKIASIEYRAMGIATALSPQIDIATDPRWSRYNGTFGEDPKLASAMSRSYVDGFQTTYNNTDGSTAGVYDGVANDAARGGWGLQSVNAMMKHWPGGGAGEGGRDAHYNYGKYAVFPGGNFEAHLIPFVDGSLSLEDGTDMATAVMPYYTVSYLQTPGSVPNGSNSAAAKLNMANAYNDYMINGVLRDSYQFEGVVCTDWNVVGPKTATDNSFDGDLAGMIWGVDDHYPDAEGIDTDGSYTNMAKRARLLLDAGVDQFGGLNTTAPILKAYENASAAEKPALKDQMANSSYRLLKNIFRTGLFENPYLDAAQTTATVGEADFMEAGYDAQLKSMVLAKNAGNLLPLNKAATKIYTPGITQQAQIDLFETYFGAGNVFSDPADAANADVALVFISSVSSGGGSRNAVAHTNSYTPINLDFKSYTAVNARSTSVAGEPIRDGAGAVIGQGNRTYKGLTTAAASAAASQLTNLAAAKASGKPVVVVFDTSRPSVLSEIEPSASAILVSFASQRSAVLDMLTGSTAHKGTAQAIFPTGLLPLQFPRDMNEVETQSEDVPRDMIPYTDSAGNAYDFGFGLTWKNGPTSRIDASVNPGYTAFVAENAVPMTMPLNTGRNAASAYSILKRVEVDFDYGYKEAANDEANKSLILVVESGKPVAAQTAARAGHVFDGWYTAAGAKFDFTSPITADTKLTAYWDGAVPPGPGADALVKAAVRDGLVSLVAASAIGPAGFTAASWTALKTARDAAVALAANSSATEAQLKAAAAALSRAVAGLKPVAGAAVGKVKAGTVKLTGTAKVGKKLTAKASGWTAGVTYHYQWYQGKKKIKNATNKALKLKAAYKGKKIKVKVTATKTGLVSAAKNSAAKKIKK